jgi:thiol-disulfide isomerase/thioredoxin
VTNVSRVCGVLLLSLVCGIGAAQQEAKIRLAPQVLRAGEHGVGQLAADVAFRDLSGNESRVGQVANDHRAVVFAMSSTSCPLSKKYFPSLVDLARTYANRGVRFVVVNPVATDDEEAMRRQQKELGTDALYVFDRKGSLAKSLGARTTGDVIVVDSARTVVYHGAVDDQYGFGYSLNAPRKKYLADALDALLDNRVPLTEATAAPGCMLDVAKPQIAQHGSPKQLTYHGRISRLMQRRCVACHRDEGVAPFPLDTYEDVTSHSPMISFVVKRAIMPPWFAATSDKSKPSPWANDCSLSETEKRDLLAWIEGDQVEGDVADAPRPLVFADEWEIGKPDAVFSFDEPVPVKATGIIPYKYITVETDVTEDKWIQAIEIQPGERTVVHHILVLIRPPAARNRRTRSGMGAVDYWAIYVPGNGAQIYPEGYARRLPKGARLVFQMHYTTNGTATKDRTRIGMIFADKPPKHEVKTASIVDDQFQIPPGADNYQVESSISIPADVQVLGYLPHHHLRGKASRYELLNGAHEPELLLDVPRYDFNWQLFYKYAEPRIIKGGSTIRFTAWYDNSKDNPANPNPTRTVGWGPQTYDEMHIGYVEYAVLEDNANPEKRPRTRSFAALDTNQNGSITLTEIRVIAPNTPRRKAAVIFNRFDADDSGELNETEFGHLQTFLDK